MAESPVKPFSGIFVSYRRDDSAGHAGRLKDRLRARFGDEQIFMDVDHIRPGEDFITVIETALASCEILIAVIGRQWPSIGEDSLRRLDDPEDPVRLEIATALSRDIPVIPVLVHRATMPKPKDLPEDLAKLSRRNAMELSDLSWHDDVDKLISRMERVLAERAEEVRLAEETSQAEADRERLEDEERRRVVKERQLLEKEEIRQKQELQRLSQDDIKRRDLEGERLAKGEAVRKAEQQERQAREASWRRAREPNWIERKLERFRIRLMQTTKRFRLKKTKKSAEADFFDRWHDDLESSASMNEFFGQIRSGHRSPRRNQMVVGGLLVLLIVAVVGISQIPKRETSVYPAATPTITPLASPATDSLARTAQSSLPKTSGFTNKFGIEMIYVPSGTFMMGSTKEVDATPVHQITINYSFYMGKYEVTQGEWGSVMGRNPSKFKDCATCPVERVTFRDVQSFINKLNASNDGFRYRLPTETEWEYACRAETTGDYAGNLSEMAWYSSNSGKKTHAVGGRQSNAWGLYDMHGNVWEWCNDLYQDDYKGAPDDGSSRLNDLDSLGRVLRGGSWADDARSSRSAYRTYSDGDTASDQFGFRLVAVVPTR